MRPGANEAVSGRGGTSKRVEAGTFSALGCSPASEMKWMKKSASVAHSQTFERENLMYEMQPLEENPDGLDVGSRVRIKHNHVVEVHRYLIETFYTLVSHAHIPTT